MLIIDQYPKKIYEIVFIHYLVEADTEEDVELLIFDRNTSTKLTRSDVFKVTNKANLTRHGYKEEVSYQTVMSPDSTSYFKASTRFWLLEFSGINQSPKQLLSLSEIKIEFNSIVLRFFFPGSFLFRFYSQWVSVF